MIYQEFNEYDMQRMLAEADRDNFSLEALRAYIAFSEEVGEDTEFDPVGFDCSFTEFDLTDCENVKTFINDYGYLVEGEEFDEENDKVEAIQSAIKEKTLVISSDDDCFLFEYNF